MIERHVKSSWIRMSLIRFLGCRVERLPTPLKLLFSTESTTDIVKWAGNDEMRNPLKYVGQYRRGQLWINFMDAGPNVVKLPLCKTMRKTEGKFTWDIAGDIKRYGNVELRASFWNKRKNRSCKSASSGVQPVDVPTLDMSPRMSVSYCAVSHMWKVSIPIARLVGLLSSYWMLALRLMESEIYRFPWIYYPILVLPDCRQIVFWLLIAISEYYISKRKTTIY